MVNFVEQENKNGLNWISRGNNEINELEANGDFKILKQELDKGYNFIDYFLVLGLEPGIFRNKWLFTEDYEVLIEKHKEELKPKIISAFPHFEKSTTSFNDAVLNHCFPNGYQLIKSQATLKPEVFSFILDNNFFNINYPQKYLSCLICYENITQYKLLEEMANRDEGNSINENSTLLKSIREPDIQKAFQNNSNKNKNESSKKEKNIIDSNKQSNNITNNKQNNNKQKDNNDNTINNMQSDYNIFNNININNNNNINYNNYNIKDSNINFNF